MTANTDALIESIKGGPVLDPGDLAAAFVDAANVERLGDVRAAMDTKPGPRIPPRYESEVRTWLSRVTLDHDAPYARIQAYAATHLDPNNTDALAALDDACASLGEDVRARTWSAVVHSYPDVKAVRTAVSGAGLPLPERDLQRNAAKRSAARKGRRRVDEPVLVEADGEDPRSEVAGPRPARDKPARTKSGKTRPQGYASLVPALEPDAVRADRLAVLHLVAGTEWICPPGATDPLSVATARLRGDKAGDLPPDATGTATYVALDTGGVTEGRGPLYGRLLRRMKNHPGVVVWAVRRQVAEGDVTGARLARERVEGPPAVWAEDFAEIDRLLGIAAGDAEAGWSAWQEGDLPYGLRPQLARTLQAAGRGHDADEVLGLPDVPADEIDDPALLCVRFDLLYVDGDVDGALAQARRAVLLHATPQTVSRLWLGLCAMGELDELAARMEDDADAAGASVEDLIATGRSLQERRVAVILGSVRDDVEGTRSALQELAKGRTIRETEMFEAAVMDARTRLTGLAEALSLVTPPRPGRYPAAAEDLVSFLAAAGGLATRLDGEFVVTETSGESAVEPAAVAPFFEPARELIGRADVLAGLLARANAELEIVAEQGRREDVPRRRLEERVARQARAAVATLTTLLDVLDVFSPLPDGDLVGAVGEIDRDAGADPPDTDPPDTDLPDSGAHDTGPDVADAAGAESPDPDADRELDAEADSAVEVEGPADVPADETSAGRWFRRRR